MGLLFFYLQISFFFNSRILIESSSPTLYPRRFSTTHASRASLPMVTVTLGILSANLGIIASVTEIFKKICNVNKVICINGSKNSKQRFVRKYKEEDETPGECL